ncbi:family 43 glycosylhydrolase [Nocardioides alcanivorans]|uniref:family 43 glycosylhydrolase n=1 Tax=Nocardioides alcanivorans TaxID=2897352 RepID=UPI001F3A38E6|nr:family 43 glycosylhydrolase [Nocardioides alcanivorans]
MGRKQLVVCAALLAMLGALWGAPAAATKDAADPVYVGRHFGDPAVVRAGGTFIAVGTGPLTLRLKGTSLRKWKSLPPVLKRLPTWARNGDIWAADLAKVRKKWVLYYSAPVKGLTPSGRCIGVAKARKPTASFKPVDKAPLVCPAKGKTPGAGNQAPGEGLPRHGVIDPSLFVGSDGWPVLFYKTDGLPSTIRMLPLRKNGLEPRKGAISREVLRSAGVIENPVVVQRGRSWFLFTSEGSYTRCTYATLWRKASSPTAGRASSPRCCWTVVRQACAARPGPTYSPIGPA